MKRFHEDAKLLHANMRVAVIPNSFDLPRGLFPRSRNAAIASGRLRVGYVGRFDEAKGLRVLLREFGLINPDTFELILAGADNGRFEAAITKLRNTHSVTSLGYLPQAEILSLVDVLVVPSLWHEPFGRTVIEAYVYGVPVIAARRGALPELVHDGRTGFLFEPCNHGELAKAIQRLLDPTARDLLATNARIEGQKYTTGAMVRRYADFYDSLRTE